MAFMPVTLAMSMSCTNSAARLRSLNSAMSMIVMRSPSVQPIGFRIVPVGDERFQNRSCPSQIVEGDPNMGFCNRDRYGAVDRGPGGGPIRARSVRSESPKSEPTSPFMERYP